MLCNHQYTINHGFSEHVTLFTTLIEFVDMQPCVYGIYLEHRRRGANELAH